MVNKYVVYQTNGRQTQYIRIDERGLHWMENDKLNATRLPREKARNFARQNNQNATIGGYTPMWGIEIG